MLTIADLRVATTNASDGERNTELDLKASKGFIAVTRNNEIRRYLNVDEYLTWKPGRVPT